MDHWTKSMFPFSLLDFSPVPGTVRMPSLCIRCHGRQSATTVIALPFASSWSYQNVQRADHSIILTEGTLEPPLSRSTEEFHLRLLTR